MSLLRHPALFRAYPYLPHGWMNRLVALAARARRPRWLVRAAVREWIRRDRISMADFADADWASVEEFFLRRLQPQARPIGEGTVSPCDGALVAQGRIGEDTSLDVKGWRLSIDRIVNGRLHRLSIAPLSGGYYAAIFLSPCGYHRIHAPADGTVDGVQWLPGRFFPQNEDALQAIDGVYERNERAVLSCSFGLLVMVGASLIGGIHLRVRPGDSCARAMRSVTSLLARRSCCCCHRRRGSSRGWPWVHKWRWARRSSKPHSSPYGHNADFDSAPE